MGSTTNIFHRLGRIGEAADVPPQEVRYTRFLNVASGLVTLTSVAFFIPEAMVITDWGKITGTEWLVLVGRFVGGLLFAAPLVMNRLGHHSAARLFFVLWGVVFCSSLAFVYGVWIPANLFIVVAVMLSVFMFPEAETGRVKWVLTACLVGFGAILVAWERGQPLVPVHRPGVRQAVMLVGSFGALLVAFLVASVQRRTVITAERRLTAAQEKADRLLLNVLPEPIAARLKDGAGLIADGFEEVSVLFADLVGFTELSARLEPAEIVSLLDEVFSRFDQETARHGLEKIKTIGDAYMVAAGVPTPLDDGVEAIARMALALPGIVAAVGGGRGHPLEVRIGIATGPAVAGVIGEHKFAYDLWGDTVNTASRLEAHGEPGRIQVDEATHGRLESTFELEARGAIEVKGKGLTPAWWLLGPNQA